MDTTKIVNICNAYELGILDKMENKTFNCNNFKNSDMNFAYERGYKNTESVNCLYFKLKLIKKIVNEVE